MAHKSLGGTARTNPTRLAGTLRDIEATRLRLAGATYQQIADKLGYHYKGTAYRAVMRCLKETKREPAEPLKTLELERMDRMLLGLWDKATHGDARAVDAVLRIMKRRAEMLGLDAPIKNEITVKDIDTAIERELENLAAASKASDAATAEDIEPGEGDE